MGEPVWGKVSDQILRMSTALAGGLGCSHQDLCGVLSAGALIIGSEHGRARPGDEDSECNRRVIEYRLRFQQQFGNTRCQDLRASGYGSDGQWPCSALAAGATHMLCQVLAE